MGLCSAQAHLERVIQRAGSNRSYKSAKHGATRSPDGAIAESGGFPLLAESQN